MESRWGGTAKRGEIFMVTSQEDCSRVGHCWAQDRLTPGSILICLQRSGDCFNDYLWLEDFWVEADGQVRAKAFPDPVGSYELGESLSKRNQARDLVLVSDTLLGLLQEGWVTQIAPLTSFPGPVQAQLEQAFLEKNTRSPESSSKKTAIRLRV